MKKWLKKNFVYIVIVLSIVSLSTTIYKYRQSLTADSGFDSSYDGGGSSGGSSSSSSSGGEGEGSPEQFAIAVILIVIYWIYQGIKYQEIRDEKFKEYISEDKQKFYQDRYVDYVDIQEAWMNFDYKKLRSKLTDELYNQYEMQLETLKEENRQNIMKDFEFESIKAINIGESNDIITVVMLLNVKQIDYIEEDGECVRGDEETPMDMTYELTFICNKKNDVNYCPSCGNKLNSDHSQVCPYCRSKVSLTTSKWVLSKKKVISQR